MKILALDTSGPIITVGTAENSCALARRDARAERGKGNALEAMIEDVLAVTHWTRRDVEGLALVVGPGSLTAIRIGWATVVGWAQARGIPVTGWSVPLVQQRKLGEQARHALCCTHFRGDMYLLYNLAKLDSPPMTARLNGEDHSAAPPAMLTGPGVIENRAMWTAYFGAGTRVVPDDEAFVGADLLALWAEADLSDGRALSIDRSPLEYGLPPDFKKLASV